MADSSFDVASVPPAELTFLVEEAEGGFLARAVGASIFTEAESLSELRAGIRDAVQCHFDEGQAPQVIRLRFVREEVMQLAA